MARLDETRSSASSRSEARGSGVLARAREYNRIIDENRSRSRSGERQPVHVSEPDFPSPIRTRELPSTKTNSQVPATSRGLSTKERAIMSLESDAFASGRPESPVRNGPSKPSSQSAQSKNHNSLKINTVHSPQLSPVVKQHENDGNKGPSMTNAKSPVNFQAVSKQIAAQSLSPEQQHKKTHPVDPQSQPVVTPELLVDALSGHEDGLLAIAERLMEHYDEGYDSMGEAIIDAFADVQKLFQHVVEAAHMEGAAYEAGRREEEAEKMKKSGVSKEKETSLPEPASGKTDGDPADAGSQSRHDEFIDEDVREILEQAVSEGRTLKEKQKYADCYVLYEQACQSASALLPVDSDHRGRLQLSLARAESMNPERACAILKYVIDDVLRSGLDSNVKVVMPDPSKRGDCVLQRPTPLKTSLSNIEVAKTAIDAFASDDGNFQRSEEVLASLVEEMKEVLSAPMYANCHPLQDVASRFWVALTETQRMSLKNEERLEQKLGNLKGEYLLDREEWEDKYNALFLEYSAYKKKMERMQETMRMQSAGGHSSTHPYYDDVRGLEDLNDLTLHPIYSAAQSPPKEAASVVSLENLTYHARSIFSCNSSMDDLQENGGPVPQEKYKMSPAMGKVSDNYLSHLDRSSEMRAFGNARNR